MGGAADEAVLKKEIKRFSSDWHSVGLRAEIAPKNVKKRNLHVPVCEICWSVHLKLGNGYL
jgi:hypothetical protein